MHLAVELAMHEGIKKVHWKQFDYAKPEVKTYLNLKKCYLQQLHTLFQSLK